MRLKVRRNLRRIQAVFRRCDSARPTAAELGRRLWLLCLVLATAPAAAAELPKPGDYRSGYGSLLISRQQQQLRFSIDAVGPNAHTCTLTGTITDKGLGLATDGDPSQACEVDFLPIAGGYRVSAKTKFCRDFCGVRASFDADYVIPPTGCSATAIATSRKQFLTLYQRRQYAQAVQLLSPIPERCFKVLGRFEDGWVRNDLALAQYHLGDAAACRATLEPLRDWAQDDDGGGAEPSFQNELRRLAKATRTNLKLCGRSPQ